MISTRVFVTAPLMKPATMDALSLWLKILENALATVVVLQVALAKVVINANNMSRQFASDTVQADTSISVT